MSLWGTKPIKVNSFSTDSAASFNMDSSFQMIPVEVLPPSKPVHVPTPMPKENVINMEILQSIMPPGVIKKNAHLINLILKNSKDGRPH